MARGMVMKVVAAVASVVAAVAVAEGAGAGRGRAEMLAATSPLRGQLAAFEVVHVRRAESASLKSEGAHPEEVVYELDAFGQSHRLELVRNAHVVAPDYRELFLAADGSVIREVRAEERPNCYYRGREAGSGMRASFATCGGLSGAFYSPTLGSVNIEPAHHHLDERHPEAQGLAEASAEAGGAHIAFLSSDLVNAPKNAHCGNGNHDLLTAAFPVASSASSGDHDDHDHDHDHDDHDHDHNDHNDHNDHKDHEHRGPLALLRAAAAGASGATASASFPAGPLSSFSRPVRAMATQTFVDQFVVHDFQRFTLLGNRSTTNALVLVNHANNAYLDAGDSRGFNFQPVISVRLQSVWTQGDPFVPTSAGCSGCGAEVKSASSVLDKFKQALGNSTVVGGAPMATRFANAYLLTGYNVGSATSDGVVGLATVGGMCLIPRPLSAGLVETTAGLSYLFQGITLAHELGHNFNMSHDQDSGCAATFIMSSSSDASDPPSQFSTCSRDWFNGFMGVPSNRACLGASASAPLTYCGNGIIEAGEDCDCGVNGCSGGVDRCCQSDCTFTAGSTCSELDACCAFNATSSRCGLRPAGFSCRAARSASCDLAEQCDGASRFCPVDQFYGAGVSCGTSGGACFAGECVSGLQTCQEEFASSPNIRDATVDEQTTFTGSRGLDWCALALCTNGTHLLTKGGPEADGTPCNADLSRVCVQAVCTPAANATAAAAVDAGTSVEWTNFTEFSECRCEVQTRNATCTIDGEVAANPSVCFPPPASLSRACEVPANSTFDPTECPGVCATSQYDIPKIGCTEKNYVYYVAGGVGALILLCVLYKCCCTGSKRVK